MAPEVAPKTVAGPLPANARRLFPHHHDADLAAESSAPFVIGKLLEEGETADLHWLCEAFGEERLRSWLAGRGGRQLSRRSRAFWALVLGTEPGEPAAGAEGLWPL